VFYGFVLCFAATVAAAIEQELLGIQPPYPVLSVPVLLGLIGGIGMLVGCIGLVALKRRSAGELTGESVRAADEGLLGALLVLAGTGVLTLLLRATPTFGVILLIHLAAIVVCFAVAPYTKFVHWVYRLLAIYADERENQHA
jgi:citrate/tricarballylate utilization protein